MLQRSKKCKVCKCEYHPSRPLQKVCGYSCAISLAKSDRAKAERKELIKARERAKTRRQWQAEAQAAFNAFIRARDADLPCVSCGRHHDGQYHAGHYMPTSTRPSLRFNELNVQKQCQPCNTHLHGNIAMYRMELIRRIGLDKVEWLEGIHEPSKHSIAELQGIKEEYRKKAREILKGRL